jgi:hypothetical protein
VKITWKLSALSAVGVMVTIPDWSSATTAATCKLLGVMISPKLALSSGAQFSIEMLAKTIEIKIFIFFILCIFKLKKFLVVI